MVVNTYAVYARDIDPLGFKTIEMTQLVTRDVVEQTRAVLQDQALREDWAKTNYALGREILLLRRGPPQTRRPPGQPLWRRRLIPGSL